MDPGQSAGPVSPDDPLETVRQSLGGDPVEFATAGELASLMATLPAQTSVQIAWHVAIDANLGDGEDRSTNLVRAVAVLEDQEVVVGADGYGILTGREVPAVELSAAFVSHTGPLPATTHAYEPYGRAHQALRQGDAAGMFDAYRELLEFVAGMLDGGFDASMREVWVGANELGDALDVEAERLRHAAARLEALQRQVLAWLDRRT